VKPAEPIRASSAMRTMSSAMATTRRRVGRRRGTSLPFNTIVVTTVTQRAKNHVVPVNSLTSLVVVKSRSKWRCGQIAIPPNVT